MRAATDDVPLGQAQNHPLCLRPLPDPAVPIPPSPRLFEAPSQFHCCCRHLYRHYALVSPLRFPRSLLLFFANHFHGLVPLVALLILPIPYTDQPGALVGMELFSTVLFRVQG